MVEIAFPGVFVEETSFRAKSIEGVSTSTTGFIGPTRFGPLDVIPRLITSLADFEGTYGDGKHLNFSDAGEMDNYLWHAARAFFEEGGKRLYISRVFKLGKDTGIACATLPGRGGTNAIGIKARCPGETGNMHVRFDLRVDQNILDTDENRLQRVNGLSDHGRVTVNVTLTSSDRSHSATFERTPDDLAAARSLPIMFDLDGREVSGVELLSALFGSDNADEPKFAEVVLSGGNDGARPTAIEYEGTTEPKTGLKIFEDIDHLSIVAAPGSSFNYESGYGSEADTIIRLLIDHAERMRNRIAVIDNGDRQSISQVRAMRAKFDSTHAAFYFPWILVLDPFTSKEIGLPPSSFVAGIYVRTDSNQGVFKAPANEVVNLARGLETLVTKAQQDVLNSEGINCFRVFERRGVRLWGARTISSDPEWKFVNIRRYFAYLEQSIAKGTQWVVFEPNGEPLWDNVRRTIEDFLLKEWRSGALMGDRPENAFFIKCDRSTMTQNDLDNGRLICLIGVAPLRPAEFVIFRIGQWTADHDDDD